MSLPYPYCLLNENIHPILGEDFNELPLYFEFTDRESDLVKLQNTKTQKEVCEYIFEELLEKSESKWSVCGYLENRKSLLEKYDYFVQQERYYHLGLDITVPLGTPLFAPLDSEVALVDYESEEGGYGNLVVLKHSVNGTIFYSLYGHLSSEDLPKQGEKISKGEKFAKVGDYHENGNWFYHTHLEVLTEKAFDEGWVHKGYCTAEDLKEITNLCPNPVFLLKI